MSETATRGSVSLRMAPVVAAMRLVRQLTMKDELLALTWRGNRLTQLHGFVGDFVGERVVRSRRVGSREDGDAAVAGGVDRADAEDDVVLGDGELEVWAVPALSAVGPGGLVGGAPDDLVGGAGGSADGRLPGELGVVVEGRGEDVDVLRRAGCGGQRGEGGGVEAGDVGDVVEVDVLEEVAVLDAVFDADVLVLVVEVLGATR